MAAAVETPVPSYMRTVPGSVNLPVAKLPKPATTAANPPNPAQIAASFAQAFNAALASKDYAAIAKLFVADGYWRDHLAVTWQFRTLHTTAKIQSFLEKSSGGDGIRLKSIAVSEDKEGARAPHIVSLSSKSDVPVLRFFFSVETALGKGTGVAKLTEESAGQWKAYTLYTRLDELRGFEEGTFERRPKGVEHGGKPGRKNWVERREGEKNLEGKEPVVLVVGAGQAGLTAAARLKMLGVETLVIDQNQRVGDNWRKRYHQLVLHDPIWYDHLPYLPFPPQWPIFTPKDKLAQFFEAYATLLELNIWTRTDLVYTKWDEEKQIWTVIVDRKREDGTSEIRTFHPRHVIQATGHSGKKNMPEMKGIENFRGDRLCHSSEFSGAKDYTSADPSEKKKKAVVVGSCNSAHDISQDFLEKGYDITIVQRSTTHVVSSKAITDIGLAGVYSEDGPPVDDADLIIHGQPMSLLKADQIEVAEREAEHDKDIIQRLEKAGFKVDGGPDGAGLFFKYFQRGGGYYIDVGASALIADGKIKVKQGQEIDEILPHGIRFADGTELEADEIVFATGYQNMRTQTRITFGDEIADRVGDVWGFNEEGEMRTIWQASGHPGFWFHGGNLALCRYYSRLLALQIKGIEEGLYKPGEV